MKVLLIFNHAPYDSTDLAWNGLRLADKLVDAGNDVRLFLMNEAVDMARNACIPPEGYDQDLVVMLKALIARGVIVKVCGTCMARCGIYKNQPYCEGAEMSTMPALAEWVVESDRIISF
ncbi:DsrE family protein [Accumulibacter sp.]|uniref:DsrE/DsrF/TusD sulfur relay family protein n=1 Tax=Accumulibacter sp. TaxID=2053492 RepID=UPI001AC79B04|nr:DsrE family protein [Accumulibacter sp.]MBN8455861.1 DsrE family protein [Accumulibacter sp.]MBO3705916.1 DsrE family protein [Candidatus Accumulibacter conexus]